MPNPKHFYRLICLGSQVFALMATATLAGAQQAPADDARMDRQTVATGLQHPWAVAFLPQGRFLVTERPGRMRVIDADGRVRPPLQGLPETAAAGQGGLLDVITDSDFAANRTIYFCFSEPGLGTASSTALASAQLTADMQQLQNVRILFSQQPKHRSSLHFGCRIVERQVNGKPDGTLFLTLGERYDRRDDAQTLDNHHGKTVRIGKDGSVPSDNPFAGKAGARPEIWSYGHRNSQGAVMGPDGTLWMHEHGARGGDEINQVNPGRNYGWPVVSFGVNYDGSPVGQGQSAKAGMAPPLLHWTPSIAPSGMAWLHSDRYGPDWQGSLFVGALKGQHLVRIEWKNGQPGAQHTLLQTWGQRIRDVRQGPDGLLYVLTDSSRGQLVRLQPKP